MAKLLSGYVDKEEFPFILVTPDDTNMTPTSGMDWAIATVDENNKEALLFDEILACLDTQFNIDLDHIHSAGFSAGAITTDLLAVTRGDVLASTYTFSGGYFSNPENTISFTRI